MVTSLLASVSPSSPHCAGKIGIKEQILVLAQLAQQLVSATNGVSVACTFAPKNWIRTAHELQAPT